MDRSSSHGVRFVDSAAAGELLGLSRRTLDRWRWAGRGPRFRKHGSRVVYAVADLVAWSEQHVRSSTSDVGDHGPEPEQ